MISARRTVTHDQRQQRNARLAVEQRGDGQRRHRARQGHQPADHGGHRRLRLRSLSLAERQPQRAHCTSAETLRLFPFPRCHPSGSRATAGGSAEHRRAVVRAQKYLHRRSRPRTSCAARCTLAWRLKRSCVTASVTRGGGGASVGSSSAAPSPHSRTCKPLHHARVDALQQRRELGSRWRWGGLEDVAFRRRRRRRRRGTTPRSS